MHLMYNLDAAGKRVYTLKKVTGASEVTKSAHPARFSPDDKWSKYVSFHLLRSPVLADWSMGAMDQFYMTKDKAKDEVPMDGRQGSLRTQRSGNMTRHDG